MATGFGDELAWYCPSIDDSADDLSGNGWHGTYQAGMGTVADTTYGGVRAYNVTTSGQWATTSLDLNTAGPFTFAFWTKTAPATGNNFGCTGTTRLHCHCPLGPGDRTLYWDYGGFSGAARLTANYTPHWDAWTFVVLMSNGAANSGQWIYLNGSLAASKGTSAGSATSSGNFRVCGGLFLGSQFNRTDDIRLFTRILTPEEITEWWNGGRGYQRSGHVRSRHFGRAFNRAFSRGVL